MKLVAKPRLLGKPAVPSSESNDDSLSANGREGYLVQYPVQDFFYGNAIAGNSTSSIGNSDLGTVTASERI